MKRKPLRGACALGAGLALLLLPTTANALVLGGGVTGGTSGGSFELLAPPPAAAGPDAFESPNLIAFNERQDFVLQAPLPIGPGVTLGVGSVVSSHYVAFDPADGATLNGFIDFDEPIIGLVTGPQALTGTATLLGRPTVSYSVAPAIGPDTPTDTLAIAAGMPNRLLVQFGANSPGDQLRVLTGIAIPEPSVAALAVSALIGLAGVAQRA